MDHVGSKTAHIQEADWRHPRTRLAYGACWHFDFHPHGGLDLEQEMEEWVAADDHHSGQSLGAAQVVHLQVPAAPPRQIYTPLADPIRGPPADDWLDDDLGKAEELLSGRPAAHCRDAQWHHDRKRRLWEAGGYSSGEPERGGCESCWTSARPGWRRDVTTERHVDGP